MTITAPTQVAGCIAWYSALMQTGYTDGQEMTQWDDQSGSGNHATGVAGSALAKPLWKQTGGPTANGPHVFFQSASAGAQGGYFTLPNIVNGLASAEAFVSVNVGVSNSAIWTFGNSGDSPHYPFSDTTIYENFGFAGFPFRYSSVSTVLPLVGSWRRYSAYGKADGGANFVDGIAQAGGTGAVGFPVTPKLGRADQAGWNLGGKVGAFVLFNRKLAASERADVNTWLAENMAGGIGSSGRTGATR